MHQRLAALKPLANRLAGAISSKEGTQLTKMLSAIGVLGSVDNDAAHASRISMGDSGRVGIWAKDPSGSGAFLRDAETMNKWHEWANVGRIERKSEVFRVLLLGESVARGYFLDPHYTPAKVLETILNRVLGSGSVGVVDLARTNISTEVKELALAAAALAPDMVVVFSGNNWYPPPPRTEQEKAHFDALWSSEGVEGVRAFAEERLAERARDVVVGISEFYAEKGVPVIWVVPEFNLADWRDWRANAPRLRTAAANREWILHAEAAEEALRRSDHLDALRQAEQMIELDGANCTYSLTLRAECALALGDKTGGQSFLERARDARIWDWSQPTPPRPYSITQGLIRQEAASRNLPIVDLPALIRERQGDPLPGRRWFFDYCHLTDEGIRVSMAGVAARFLDLLGKPSPGIEALLQEAPVPSPVHRAEASLLAAIHNAHWWQPQKIILHHCLQALDASPDAAELMRQYMDLQTLHAPKLMSRAAERIAQLASQSAQHYILRLSEQQLDAPLLLCMDEALRTSGASSGEHLSDRWRRERRVGRYPVDLLHFYYLSSASEPKELLWAMPRKGNGPQQVAVDYYRAYWVQSTFSFIGEHGTPISLRLTCRIPGAADSAGKAISVWANGRKIGTVAAQGRWRTHSIDVAGDYILDGLNTLVIHWPHSGAEEPEPTSTVLAAASHPLFSVFGEVHELTASSSLDLEGLPNEQDQVG